MDFFYNNFDFIYLYICIMLLATSVCVYELIKLDKINRYRLKYVVLFLILQSALYLMDILLIYLPVDIKVEFLRIPLILIAFAVLFETFLYTISNKKKATFVRYSLYLSAFLALVIAGVFKEISWFNYYVQAYCFLITIIVFYSLTTNYISNKKSKLGLIGIGFSFLYVFVFCLNPSLPLRYLLVEDASPYVLYQTYFQLLATAAGCYSIWIHLSNEVSDNFIEDGGSQELNKFPKHLIGISFIFALCSGWLCIDFVSKLAEKNNISNLENKTNLILSTLSVSHINKMATSYDLDAERSRYLVEQRLNSITSSQSDIRFIYLLSMKENGEIVYDLEMEPYSFKIFNPVFTTGISEEEDESFDAKAIEVFKSGQTKIFAPFFDRTGVWTTILVPIKNADTGKVFAVLGVDMDYFEWKVSIFQFRMFPVLFTLLLSLFLIFIFRDMLNRRKIEQDIATHNQNLLSLNITLKHTKEELEQANKTKSEFLSSMSHELRTPLNAILGFAEILEAEMFGPLGEKYQEYAKLIHKSGNHLLSLINDVLDISKIEAGKMQVTKSDVSIFQMLEDCFNITLAYPGAQERRFITEFPEKDITINADERMLKQILLNLLSNAIKFTPKNGEIKLIVTYEDDFVHFVVADKGIGISQENIKKILEPFSQVEDAQTKTYQGTGLGLPIVVKLIELHGGVFNINSKLGDGTRISFTIPKV